MLGWSPGLLDTFVSNSYVGCAGPRFESEDTFEPLKVTFSDKATVSTL